MTRVRIDLNISLDGYASSEGVIVPAIAP